VAVALVLLASLRYATALDGGFVLDDQRAVLGNRCVIQHPGPGCAFGHDFWGRPASEVGRSYRPLTVLTFALDWAVGGGRAFSFHLSNVLYHVGATLAVLAFLLALQRRRERVEIPTLAAAALFATFGAHTDAVAGIVGRADVLATGLAAGALALHLRGGGSLRSIAGTALLCLAAMLCHEVGVLAPALVVLCDIVLGRLARGELRRRLPAYIALAAVTAGYLALRVAVLGRLVGPPPPALNNPAVDADALGRILFALASMGRGVSVLFFPLHLSAEYGYAEITVPESPLDGHVIVGAVAVVALFLGVVWGARRSALLAAGCGTLLLGLVLISNGPVLMPTAFGERLLYLPSVGAAALLGGLVGLGARRSDRIMVAHVAVAVVLLINLSIGLHENRSWRDSVTLFENATASCPRSARAHLNLGLALNKEGEHARAIGALRKALAIEPRLVDAAVELAKAYDMVGRSEKARRLFESALRRMPGHRPVVHGYARLLIRHREVARAKKLLRGHVDRDPKDPVARALLRRLELLR
jgi:tetratricopeptide (TPR) repeat protein